MRLGAILPLALLAGCQPASGRGGGIVSTNPCADAILTRLVEPGRIAAISRYSQDPASSSMPLALARSLPATAGTAEEVIALRPALVLADSFAPAATLAAYTRAGLRVVVLGSPTTVAASVAQIRQVATAVGESARGETVVQEIAAAGISPARGRGPLAERWRRRAVSVPSAEFTRHPRAGEVPASALLYLSGDLASGSGNLLDELLTRAGFRNAAADYGLVYAGTIPLETLVARPPGVIISTGAGRSAALRRQLLPHVREAIFPRTLINCGGPSIPPALARLRAIRASL